jgi:hypothetical protein
VKSRSLSLVFAGSINEASFAKPLENLVVHEVTHRDRVIVASGVEGFYWLHRIGLFSSLTTKRAIRQISTYCYVPLLEESVTHVATFEVCSQAR